jgi:hypothetical protein
MTAAKPLALLPGRVANLLLNRYFYIFIDDEEEAVLTLGMILLGVKVSIPSIDIAASVTI